MSEDAAGPGRAPKLVSATSMLRYGPEVAIPRILETYRRLEIRQTFFIPAWCAETHPKAVEAIASSAKTGQIGDGKIFVYSIDQAMRIRTGETDADAL